MGVYKISGATTQPVTIKLFNSSTDALITSSGISSGSYTLNAGYYPRNCYVVGLKSDGQAMAYGDINPVYIGTSIVEDTFTGTTLDTDKWLTATNGWGTVTVNDQLQLNSYLVAGSVGAHCYTKNNISKTGKLEVLFKWQGRVPYAGMDGTGALLIRSATATREGAYNSIQNRYVALCFRNYSAYNRRFAVNGSDASDKVYWSGYLQDNFGGLQFACNQWRYVYASLDFNTRVLYLNMDDGFRAGSYTFSQSIIDSLGSDVLVEFSLIDYNTSTSDLFDNVLIGKA